jgi:hypothetical protein
LDIIKGTKTSQHGLNTVGYRRATSAYTSRCKNVSLSKSYKIGNN